tara:strand:- start:18 stop:515 length:498 start_codon:yes stop_codon:yes gene_type:complete
MNLENIIALAALVIGVIIVFSGLTTDDTGVSQGDTGVSQGDTRRTSEERQTNDEIITSQICPQETCVLSHQHSSNNYTMEYSSELNLNSTCDEIKDYILSNLESSHPDVFHSSDDTSITDTMKKELIFVLENRSDMIRKDDNTTSPGIKFIFCCPDEHECIIHGD